MSIPLPTTTITVYRPDPSADEYENDTGPTLVAAGVKANIGNPKGRGSNGDGGQWESVDKLMQCDIADIRHTDVVVDDMTGESYWVQWTDKRIGLGLDHMEIGLNRATGVHF